MVGTALCAFAHPTAPYAALNRHRVDLVLPAHQLDMRTHRGGGALLVAAHDGDDDAIVFRLRLGEASEIAELGAAERLHAHARRQRDLGDVAVLRSRIDRVVEAFVDLVEAIGIAGVAQTPPSL